MIGTHLRTTSTGALLVTMSMAACPAVPPPPPEELGDMVVDGIAYRVDTQVVETDPVTIQADLELENVTRERVEVTFPDACVILLRGYRDEERTPPPDWDQARVIACAQVLVQHVLEPGQIERHQTRVRAHEVLGDSLPAGRYHLTVFLRPDTRTIEIAAGAADMAP